MSDLVTVVEQHLTALSERLERATSPAVPDQRAVGALRANADAFIMAAAQHVAAVSEVVVPAAAKMTPWARASTRTLVCTAKDLERALVVAKAKQYGQAQSVHRSRRDVWTRVATSFDMVASAERVVTRELTMALSVSEMERLGDRLLDVVERTPTRPHPHLPHDGLGGRVTRRICSRMDRVWDELEGRVCQPLEAPPTGTG